MIDEALGNRQLAVYGICMCGRRKIEKKNTPTRGCISDTCNISIPVICNVKSENNVYIYKYYYKDYFNFKIRATKKILPLEILCTVNREP